MKIVDVSMPRPKGSRCVQSSLVKDGCAQATVEFAVALPACLILALVILQVLFFCSECARFDACAREALRLYAVTQEDEKSHDLGQVSIRVRNALQEKVNSQIERVHVTYEKAQGFVYFHLLLDMTPNILGKPCSPTVFGFDLPHLEHTETLVVSPYNPDIFRRD